MAFNHQSVADQAKHHPPGLDPYRLGGMAAAIAIGRAAKPEHANIFSDLQHPQLRVDRHVDLQVVVMVQRAHRGAVDHPLADHERRNGLAEHRFTDQPIEALHPGIGVAEHPIRTRVGAERLGAERGEHVRVAGGEHALAARAGIGRVLTPARCRPLDVELEGILLPDQQLGDVMDRDCRRPAGRSRAAGIAPRSPSSTAMLLH